MAPSEPTRLATATTKVGVASSDTLPADVPERIDRYVIVGRLGEGGMGVVYRAYDEVLDRSVALKLLGSQRGINRSAQVRLLREAQALAQLSHPHVVQVYDFGEWEGHPFVALELVSGVTLTTWLSRQPRSWREIVDAYAQAARGLAAAHGVGLVHRDFKPDNVLVGDDGRIRVADFGLALPTAGDAGPTTGPAVTDSGRAVVRVTVTGSLIGTPAYMAPEQFLRLPADARSDQFAFCVSLFEALHGHRPFAGTTVAEIQRSVLYGELRAPPLRTATPQWLMDLLHRGLASAPEQRFPSMDALLAELTRDRGKGWRRLAWAGGLAGLAAGVLAFQMHTGATCQVAAEHLRDVWDPPRAATVEQALHATGVEYAADTWSRVRAGLDAYAQSWTSLHTEACQAHQRGEQSDTLLDLRMQCLQRRRTELRALVDVLAEADASTVMSAVQAVRALPALADCSDAAALLDEQRRLGRPRDLTTAAQIEQVQSGNAQIEALINAGQAVRALERSETVLQEAESVDYLPTLAEAQFWRARALLEAGAMTESAEVLRAARLTAIRADHQLVQARALLAEVYVQGDLRNFAAADAAYDDASALLSRLAPGGALEVELLNNLAIARLSAERPRDAETILKTALLLRDRSDELAPILDAIPNALGLTLFQAGSFETAERYFRDAIASFSRSLGPQHPFTCMGETNLAIMLFEIERQDDARLLIDHCLDPLIAAIGRDRADTGDLFAVRGLLLLGDDSDEALAELRHAHELGERSGNPHVRGFARFALAQGLWELVPSERERALELAHQAEADGGHPLRQQKIRAWLREHEPLGRRP